MTTAGTTFGETWDLPENATLRLLRGPGPSCGSSAARCSSRRRGTSTIRRAGRRVRALPPGLAVAWAFTNAALSICPAVHRLAA